MAKKQYAILREEKRSDFGQISRSNKHNFRQQETLNADPLKPSPTLLFGSMELSKSIRERIPKKRRKNAVIAVEVVLSASPEFFAQSTPSEYEDWKARSVEWLKKHHGDNLVQIVLHEDEATPHLHAYWVPMKDGKLNYRAIQGTPQHLVDKQTGYAAAVAGIGLHRGQPNAARRHAHHSEAASLLADTLASLDKVKRLILALSRHVGTLEGMKLLRDTLEEFAGGSRAEATPSEPTTEGRGFGRSEGVRPRFSNRSGAVPPAPRAAR